MKACGQCSRYVRIEALECPFCGTSQRAASAPWWSALAAVTLVASLGVGCGEDDGGGGDGKAEATASASMGGDGPVTTSTDSSITDPDLGEGSTYAGPDDGWTGSTTTSNGSTTEGTTTEGTTTQGTTTEGTTTQGDSSITDPDLGEGSTYAGPDPSTSDGGEG